MIAFDKLIFCFFVSISSCILASPKVDTDLKEYDATVLKMRLAFAEIPGNPDDQEWIKKKLGHMVEVDQYMRLYPNVIYTHSYNKEETEEFLKKFMSRWTEVDDSNTQDVKELLKIYDWFKISKFGKEADSNGWLLVQHADRDLAFQKTVLDILARLFTMGETNPSNYAYLYDRVAVAEKRPQRYGSQGKCVGPGEWAPHSIEDEINVDKRRAEMGLGSMEEYKAMFKEWCKKADG